MYEKLNYTERERKTGKKGGRARRRDKKWGGKVRKAKHISIKILTVMMANIICATLNACRQL